MAPDSLNPSPSADSAATPRRRWSPGIGFKVLLLAVAPVLLLAVLSLAMTARTTGLLRDTLDERNARDAHIAAVGQAVASVKQRMVEIVIATGDIMRTHQRSLVLRIPALIDETKTARARMSSTIIGFTADIQALTATLVDSTMVVDDPTRRRLGFLRRSAASLGRLFALLEVANDRTIGLMAAGDVEAANYNFVYEEIARSTAVEGLATKMAAVLGDLAAGIERNRAALRAAETRHLSAAVDAMNSRHIWIVALAALALLLLAAAYARIGLSRPLGRMVGVMRELSGGRTDVAIPPADGDDEIADMARAVEIFRRDAEALREARDELELRVHERTRELSAANVQMAREITERKQAEKRAAEAHAQLIDAIESITDGFILFDADERLVLCNSRYREFYADIGDLLVPGARLDDLLEAVVERGQVVVPLDDGDGWLAMRRAQYRKGRGAHEQLLAGGRWVLATEHRTSGGGTVGIRSDVTERRRTDAALRENRRRLANAQRIAKLGHWDLDIATGRLFWSDELFKIFAVERKDFDGTTEMFYQRLHPDDRETTRRQVAEAVERKESYSIEHRIVLPDGSTRFVREDAEIIVDDLGAPIRFSGTAQDITERKAAEERFRMLLESAPDAMVIVDRKGTIVLVNAQTETLFGHARADLIGKKIEMLMPKGFRGQHRKHRTGFFGDPHLRPMGQSLELSGLARDGREFAIEISLSPIETPEGLLVSAAVRDITERKQAEQAIRESEARLRQAQEIARIGNFEWDEATDEEIYRSDVIYDIYGVAPDEGPRTIAETLERIHPDDRERMKAAYTEVLGSGEGYDVEYRIVRPDGEVRYIHEISNPKFDESGAHVRSMGTFQDITERKQAEQAIRESEARLRRAQELARIGNFEWDGTTKKEIFRSDVIYDIFGMSPDEGPRTIANILEAIHPDDRERTRAAYDEILVSGTGYDVEYRIVRPDGEVRYIHEISNPEFDESGAHVRSMGTLQDITERKQAEEALAESEWRLRVFMDNSPAAIALKDADGRYRLVNKRFEEWYGFHADDVLGKTVHDIFSTADAALYETSEREVLETAKVVEREFEISFADGARRQLAIVKFPVFDADGRPVGVGTIDTDVTEQRQTENQLRQAQKMEAVGQLTGGIAHDFNNLLAVIAGNLELLDEAVEGQPEAQELLRWAIDAADDAATLTQRLLAFSRRQPLRPRIVEVNAMVRNLLNLLRRALGEVVDIRIVLADDLWPTLADAGQLESALLNLVLNARDALPAEGGGSVTIETANAVLDEDYASKVDEVEPGEYVVLTVSDTGHGMAAEVLDHAFEPFFTTKEVGEGSGLGLSMVYGFAQQSGGHAKIHSEEGRGTTVELYLPRAAESKRPAEAAARKPEVRGDGEKVLVVEDDAKVRDLAVKVITSLGYTVCAAADGTIALDMIEKAPDIDVMLTDVMLPGGMSGRELAERVATRRPELKVIYASGYPANVITHDGRLDEGVELLTKPYRRDVLAQALRKALGDGAG